MLLKKFKPSLCIAMGKYLQIKWKKYIRYIFFRDNTPFSEWAKDFSTRNAKITQSMQIRLHKIK